MVSLAGFKGCPLCGRNVILQAIRSVSYEGDYTAYEWGSTRPYANEIPLSELLDEISCNERWTDPLTQMALRCCDCNLVLTVEFDEVAEEWQKRPNGCTETAKIILSKARKALKERWNTRI